MSDANRHREHEALVGAVLLELGADPRWRLWRREVGVGRPLNSPKAFVRYGVPGEADIGGILKPFGRTIALECKTGTGKLSVKQKRFSAMFVDMGGLYIEVRDVQTAGLLLERASERDYSWLDQINPGF